VGVVDDPVEVDGREDIALVTEFSITTKGADVAGQLVTRALLAVEEAILAVILGAAPVGGFPTSPTLVQNPANVLKTE